LATFQELERALESEIPLSERGAFYRWVDDNYKNAWTIASDRLREAADEYIETENAFEMQRASTDYFNSCVAFASEYKKQKNKNSTEMFLESMNEKQRRS